MTTVSVISFSLKFTLQIISTIYIHVYIYIYKYNFPPTNVIQNDGKFSYAAIFKELIKQWWSRQHIETILREHNRRLTNKSNERWKRIYTLRRVILATFALTGGIMSTIRLLVFQTGYFAPEFGVIHINGLTSLVTYKYCLGKSTCDVFTWI